MILGAGILVWIPFEDVTTFWVLFFSTAICILAAVRLVSSGILEGWGRPGRHAFIGALAGLAVSPLAIGLMAFKSGLHGHGLPDFTVAQIQAVLGLSPYFTFAGLVFGLLSAFRARPAR
jgi:hypothetical protein